MKVWKHWEYGTCLLSDNTDEEIINTLANACKAQNDKPNSLS